MNVCVIQLVMHMYLHKYVCFQVSFSPSIFSNDLLVITKYSKLFLSPYFSNYVYEKYTHTPIGVKQFLNTKKLPCITIT